jgi:hypothetical protein
MRSLSGWVFDRGGAPVPNLTVTASPRHLLRSVGGSFSPGSSQHSTRTDGAGAFLFPAVLEGEYLVSTPETESYQAASATLRAGVDSAVVVVEEKSGRLVRVYGSVESARGGFLEGVRVEPVGQADRTTYTDRLGEYRLHLPVRADRTQPIRFLKNGFRESRVNITPDGSVEELMLDARLEQVEKLARVTGVVTGDDGSYVYLAGVQLYSARLGRSYRASSDRSGRFAFAEVEVGDDYRFWAHPQARYRDYVQEGLVITSAGIDLPIVLETSGEVRLSGQMVDPDGRPVPAFGLWLTTAQGGMGPLLVTGDSQGRFVVDAVPEGEIVFQTRSFPELTVSGIEISAGAAKSVRVPLDLGAHSVGGHVVDAEGAPVAGAFIFLYSSRIENAVQSRSRRESLVDSNGYFLFTQLGSGPHTLTAQAAGFRGTTVEHRVGMDEPTMVLQLQRVSP